MRSLIVEKNIVLTNKTFPQYRKKCKEPGAEFFFDKTKDIDKVKITIQ